MNPENKQTILQFKITAPIIEKLLIRRPHLEYKKDHTQIKLIAAPEGYGKSFLMTQWWEELQKQEKKVAWLSIDAKDNNPTLFLKYFIACLQSTNKELAAKAQDNLSKGGFSNLKPILETLIFELEQNQEEIFLFMDDIHYLKEGESKNLLTQLIEKSPKNIQWIISSRHQSSFHFLSLQLQEDLKHYSTKELCFNFLETQMFFSTKKIILSPNNIEQIYQKTEGWVSGLQLIALALEKASSKEDFFKEFNGQDRDIADYLYHTVFFQQNQLIQNFLLKSSIAHQFCSELCETLTKEQKSQKMLEELEKLNLFLIPLDRNRQWYRYHHLFRDFLRGQLKKNHPILYHELVQKTAKWFLEKNESDEAIRYYLEIKDDVHAAKIMSKQAIEKTHLQGDYPSFIHWCEQISEETLKNFPEIRVGYILSLLLMGQYSKCKSQINIFFQQIKNPKNDNSRNQYLALGQWVKYYYEGYCNQFENWPHAQEKWLHKNQHLPEVLLAGMKCALGYYYLIIGDFIKAKERLNSAQQVAFKHDSGNGVYWCQSGLVICDLEQNKIQQAHEQLKKLQTKDIQKLQVTTFTHATYFAIEAYIDQLSGQFETAKNSLSLANKYLNFFPYGLHIIYAARAKTWSLFFDNQENELISSMNHFISILESRNLKRYTWILKCEKCLWLLRLGKIKKAEEEIKLHRLLNPKLEEFSPVLHEQVFELKELLDIHFKLAKKQSSEINISNLNQLIHQAKSKNKNLIATRLEIAKALTLEAKGQKKTAFKLFYQVVQDCSQENSMLPFWEAGKKCLTLFENVYSKCLRFADPKISISFLTEVKKKFQSLYDTNNTHFNSNIKYDTEKFERESLTKREIEILELLETGLSQNALAKNLFISVATLRFHLRNIYRKLQVNNRSGAIARSKQLSILNNKDLRSLEY